MILYMFERKLNRIIFKIQYYGPGWYEKKKRKYGPYVDRYFWHYVNKYIEISESWPLWLKIVVPPLSLMVLWILPKLISLIVAIVYPYYTFFCTVVLDIYLSPIILFLKWLFYYPLLFLDWLTSTLKHIRYTCTRLIRLVVNQGIIASIKFVYFLVVDGVASGVREIYSIVVLSEDGWLHHLAPDFEVLIGRFKMAYFWLKRRWLSLLIYYMFFSLLRRLWRWYIYKVPNMNIEWFVDRGPTMLFLYQLRVCPFKEIWPIYKEQIYEFIFGTFMFFGYIFHMPILAFIKRYLRNIDGFRYTLKKGIKKKIRKPIFRVLVRFHLFFLPFYYFIQHVMFFSGTFLYVFTFGFSRFLLAVAVLLFILFFWLNFHKFFFDYFLFFVLNKFGFRFPRSTLYTQSVQTRAGDLYPIRKKIKSSLVLLKLNSLVDLKNTNVYSIYPNKLFNQLPFTKYNTLPRYLGSFANLFRLLRIPRKKYRSKKYGLACFGVRDSGVPYKPFDVWSPSFTKSRAEIRLRMSAPDTWRHFHFVDKFNLLHYSSLLRYSRFKGSVLLPKFTSNKFDFNTFVLKELLLFCDNNVLPSKPDDFNNHQVLKVSNNLEFFNSTNNLSVPSLGLFGKSDFFISDKNFNKISSRKSNLLSDLCYSFLGRFNFRLSKNPTFFYDTPIYRHRTGGNFRYKNVYSYTQRSIINSFKFLNNFKVLASFPRKRIRVYNPYNRTKYKAGGLLKRYIKFHRITKALPNYPTEGPFLRIFRSMFRRVDFKNSCRLIRQFAALQLRRKRRLSFDFIDQVVSIRAGSPGQRKFIYRRFVYNKFNRNFSFYKKRQRVHFSKLVRNPKIAFVIKHKFSANRGRIVLPGVISKPAVSRLSFRSFSSNLKNLRRNIVFLLRYRNKRKFFKHGTKFLIRSQLFSKKNQINKGRQLRRFFSKSNIYLSFLKSIYSRNIRLLLAVKSVSSLIINSINNNEIPYLPLFHVLEKPWWHSASLKSKNFSYFNFYSGARSAKGKLGFTNRNNFNTHFNLLKQPRRYFGRWIMSNRLLAKRYCPNRFGWVWRRKSTSIPHVFSDWRTTFWGRRFRIKNWFYKNYKVVPSILFINPAKDNRRFAFDYVFKYFHKDDVDLSLKTAFASAPNYGGFGPLLLRFTFDFKYRYKYLRKLFFGTLLYYLNSLYFIFVFCLVFYSFPSDIQPYLF